MFSWLKRELKMAENVSTLEYIFGYNVYVELCVSCTNLVVALSMSDICKPYYVPLCPPATLIAPHMPCEWDRASSLHTLCVCVIHSL